MQGKGLVFVTGDRLGDQLTALLEQAGCQVVRGPQPHPPALTVFPKEEWPQLDLPTLLRTSDVVSLHVTLTSETRHLLGAAELRLMQPHAYLIKVVFQKWRW